MRRREADENCLEIPRLRCPAMFAIFRFRKTVGLFSSEGKRKKGRITFFFFFWFGLSCEDYVRSGGSALDYRGKLVN